MALHTPCPPAHTPRWRGRVQLANDMVAPENKSVLSYDGGSGALFTSVALVAAAANATTATKVRKVVMVRAAVRPFMPDASGGKVEELKYGLDEVLRNRSSRMSQDLSPSSHCGPCFRATWDSSLAYLHYGAGANRSA